MIRIQLKFEYASTSLKGSYNFYAIWRRSQIREPSLYMYWYNFQSSIFFFIIVRSLWLATQISRCNTVVLWTFTYCGEINNYQRYCLHRSRSNDLSTVNVFEKPTILRGSPLRHSIIYLYFGVYSSWRAARTFVLSQMNWVIALVKCDRITRHFSRYAEE